MHYLKKKVYIWVKEKKNKKQKNNRITFFFSRSSCPKSLPSRLELPYINTAHAKFNAQSVIINCFCSRQRLILFLLLVDDHGLPSSLSGILSLSLSLSLERARFLEIVWSEDKMIAERRIHFLNSKFRKCTIMLILLLFLSLQKSSDDSSTSSKLVLYSFWRSSCSWRVRFALNLKGFSSSLTLLENSSSILKYRRIRVWFVVKSTVPSCLNWV